MKTIRDFIAALNFGVVNSQTVRRSDHNAGYNGGLETVIKAIKKDLPLVAYGVGIGDGIAIMRSGRRLLSYRVTNIEYPRTRESDRGWSSQLRWRRMDTPMAERTISSNPWPHKYITPDIPYIDPAPISYSWELLDIGTLERIKYNSYTQTIEFEMEELRVYLLKSGGLRCEIEGEYVSCWAMGELISKLDALGGRPDNVSQAPELANTEQRYSGYWEISDDIIETLKAEAVSYKLQEIEVISTARRNHGEKIKKKGRGYVHIKYIAGAAGCRIPC